MIFNMGVGGANAKTIFEPVCHVRILYVLCGIMEVVSDITLIKGGFMIKIMSKLEKLVGLI
jgi:hypothetical protein